MSASSTPPSTLRFSRSPYISVSGSSMKTATMRSSASTGSLQTFKSQSSPILPQRFAPVPATPPSPTTIVTNSKGNRIEISGPVNFRHLAGDMTRDMTRNAFDLSLTMNDNVLKKYMIERGITENDLIGMHKKDIIRKIVQSKYTWMPPKMEQSALEPKIVYATISQNNQKTLPTTRQPSPQPSAQISIDSDFSPSPTDSRSLSNFNLITSRFADSSQFPDPNEIFNYDIEKSCQEKLPQEVIRTKPIMSMQTSPPPPPPPSAIVAKRFNTDYVPIIAASKAQSCNTNESVYATVRTPKPLKKSIINESTSYQSAKPKLATINTVYISQTVGGDNKAETIETLTIESCYTAIPTKTRQSNMPPPPPPPPALKQMSANQGVQTINTNCNSSKPPPTTTKAYKNTAIKHIQSNDNEIQSANTVNKYSSMSIPPPLPPPSRSMANALNGGSTVTPPPPPPPPPTIQKSSNGGIPPPPPPPTMLNLSNDATNQVTLTKTTAKTTLTSSNNDGRDEFLESIRKGVTLKKVNEKAATISGIKPRAEKKPPVNDFLSELKLGITLRRVKNPENNIFSSQNLAEESHA